MTTGYSIGILDLANPTNVVQVASYDLHGEKGDAPPVFAGAVGNVVGIVDATDGLELVDLSNSASPFRLGRIPARAVAQDVELNGRYAYVAEGEADLQVVDISDPAGPRRVADSEVGRNANTVLLGNGRGYVAGTYRTQYTMGTCCTPWTLCNDFLKSAPRCAVATFDLSQPAAPVQLGQTIVEWEGLAGVSLAGRYACLVGNSRFDPPCWPPAPPFSCGATGRRGYDRHAAEDRRDVDELE